MKVPLCKPYFDDKEYLAVKEVIESGMVSSGRVADEFDKALATYCGTKYAISTNSCTSALQLTLMAYDIFEGEVITSDFTFTSSAMVAHLVGAVPVLTDIEANTRNIDPDLIQPNAATRAIIPVDYGGHPCEYDEINHKAKEADIPVIADAAHSMGSTYKRRSVGRLADVTCFSFHGTKNLAIGEGGAVVTDNTEVYEKIVFLRDCGTTLKKRFSEVPWYYHTVSRGMALLMPNTSAAIGLVQLRKLDKINKLRKENSECLTNLLEDIEGVVTPDVRGYCISNHHLYTIRLTNPNIRDRFIVHMIRKGVQCDVHYLPLHMHPFYQERGYADGEYPVSEEVYKSIVTLPMYPSMTDKEIHYVADCAKKALRGVSRASKK
jgi:dTDP-4-amino-4,6-dideoxygalactose transaminase